MLYLEAEGPKMLEDIRDHFLASFDKAGYFEPVEIFDWEHETQMEIERLTNNGKRKQIDRTLTRLQAHNHVTQLEDYSYDITRSTYTLNEDEE